MRFRGAAQPLHQRVFQQTESRFRCRGFAQAVPQGAPPGPPQVLQVNVGAGQLMGLNTEKRKRTAGPEVNAHDRSVLPGVGRKRRGICAGDDRPGESPETLPHPGPVDAQLVFMEIEHELDGSAGHYDLVRVRRSIAEMPQPPDIHPERSARRPGIIAHAARGCRTARFSSRKRRTWVRLHGATPVRPAQAVLNTKTWPLAVPTARSESSAFQANFVAAAGMVTSATIGFLRVGAQRVNTPPASPVARSSWAF